MSALYKEFERLVKDKNPQRLYKTVVGTTMKKECIAIKNPLAKKKIGNHPCPCGSGKKIKKCHGIVSWLHPADYRRMVETVKEVHTRVKKILLEGPKELEQSNTELANDNS